MTTVYVQKDEYGQYGEWASPNCFLAAYGFDMRGYEVLPFTSKALFAGDVYMRKDLIVHGGVLQVRKALELLGVRPPEPMDYPHCLRRGFMDATPVEKTVRQVMEMVQTKGYRPTFIKPSRQPKLFTGLVVSEFSDILKVINSVDEATYVYTLNPVNFLSEYRIFVHKGEMVGMSHYHGDPLVFPDVTTVKKLLNRAKAMTPVAYALDVGVAYFPDRPESIQHPTLLIEANDAHSLGAYGLPAWKYVQMVEDRWNQMTKR